MANRSRLGAEQRAYLLHVCVARYDSSSGDASDEGAIPLQCYVCIRTFMGLSHTYTYSEAMYKKRFFKWKVRKNLNEPTRQALAVRVAARSRAGKPTVIWKDGKRWDEEHRLEKRILEEFIKGGLPIQDPAEIVVPMNYDCLTPTAEQHSEDPEPTVAENYDTGKDRHGLKDDYMDTNSQDPLLGNSGLDIDFDTDMDFDFSGSMLPEQEVSSTLLARRHDKNARCCTSTISHMQLSRPAAFENIIQQPNQNTCHTKAAPIYITPYNSEPPTKTFLQLCYTSCAFRVLGRYEDADHILWQASQIFTFMVSNIHDRLLACLSSIQVTLSLKRRADDAVRVLRSAKDAAQRFLSDSHPLVLCIEFMMWQASAGKACPEISLDMLRSIYTIFETQTRLFAPHPYAIWAGYELAWRLAFNETSINEKWEALHILNRIKGDSDLVLGVRHMQSIAILRTAARLLADLGYRFDAEQTMKEAHERTKIQFPRLHPYRLEGESRYATMLQCANQEDRAEQLYIQVALGRAEALGENHEYAKASKYDVLDFLDNDDRTGELQIFHKKLKEAVLKSRKHIFSRHR